MDLKQLLYYVAIVEEGTMSAAAKKLYVGQPLLSYQLKALEDEFGVQLIERGPRRIRLTDAGAAFYQRARHMLGLSELTEQTMADFQRGLTGTLSLGTQYSSASLLLTPALIAFYNAHPRIHLVVQSGRTFELINQLLDGLRCV